MIRLGQQRTRFLTCLLLLAGCAHRPANDDLGEAQRQTELARTLESAGHKREAAHEYTIVADRFPGTSYQAVAALRAGMLYADPSNPSRSDSLAVHWLTRYLQLPIPPAERGDAEITLKLVEQSVSLRAELNRLAGSQDSLASVLKRQTSGAATLSKRISDLEAELEQTTRELQRLKEIDARARSRRKP